MRIGPSAFLLLLAFAGASWATGSRATQAAASAYPTSSIAVVVETAAPRVDAGYVPPRAMRAREIRSVGEVEAMVVLADGSLVSTRSEADGTLRVPSDWIGGELLLVARTPRKAAISVDDCPFTGCATGRNLWAASVVLTEELVAGGQIVIAAESPAAGAFAILEAAASAEAAARAAGVDAAAPVAFRWMPESNTSCSTTCFVAGSEPHIPVLGLSSDSDHFDRQIVMHEFGHFVEYQLAGRAGVGGYHDGTPTDPALAFSEGFATWFAIIASADADYVDSHRDGAAWYNYEGLTARADDSAEITQMLSEDLVVELLLRLAPAGDSAAHARILNALGDAQRATANCGAPGVDLADLLAALQRNHGIDVEGAAIQHGFPFVGDACAASAQPGTVKPNASPLQSPITPARIAVHCDESSGHIVVEASARADLVDATVIVRRVNATGQIDGAAIHDVGALPSGDGWRLELRGPWTEGLVAARLDWFLTGGSRGATVATSSCNLPDPGNWEWQASELRALPNGSRLRVAPAR